MSDSLLLESDSGTTCHCHGWSWWRCVSSPAQGVWYDVDSVVTDVLARLRLSDTDVDAARIRGLVPVAAMDINNELDRVHPMTMASGINAEPVSTDVTPTILEALSRLVVELYRRGRSDTQGNFPVEIGAAIDVVIDDIGPHKARWGLA